MLKVADLEYVLPEDRLAVAPVEPRDAARLLVVSRSDPARLEHRHVRDLPEYLRAGDVMVVNTTAVLQARLAGVRADTGGAVEGLFLGHPEESAAGAGVAGDLRPGAHVAEGRWRMLLRGKRIREGVWITLHDATGAEAGVRLLVIEPLQDDDAAGKFGGGWLVEVHGARAGETTAQMLERIGSTPLPPYIRAARRRAQSAEETATDKARYQTVYADAGAAGSVAAPTAGLHFTPGLLERLRAGGVSRGEVVLHVGTGTFKPVETEYVEQHPMHAEWCRVPPETGALIAGAKRGGGRVLAVGTTSARTLESFTPAEVHAGAAGWTRLLITPGYPWQTVDGLLTNFHLPRSTLMAMVASLLPGGVERLLEVYREAIAREYRFYSYGDAMLVLP